MAVQAKQINIALLEKFPDAIIEIQDLVGDQNHYSVSISSTQFQNITILQQHRLVKDALANLLKQDLHAVTIKTKAL